MDKEVNKGDIKIRLLSNLFWSVKKVFFYKKRVFCVLMYKLNVEGNNSCCHVTDYAKGY